MDEMSSVAREAAKNFQDVAGCPRARTAARPGTLPAGTWGASLRCGGKQASSVLAKAKVAQRVGREAQPVGMGLTILSSKSSWCCVAV
eukprot:3938546-Pleurochrysis_carterae.AAC.1